MYSIVEAEDKKLMLNIFQLSLSILTFILIILILFLVFYESKRKTYSFINILAFGLIIVEFAILIYYNLDNRVIGQSQINIIISASRFIYLYLIIYLIFLLFMITNSLIKNETGFNEFKIHFRFNLLIFILILIFSPLYFLIGTVSLNLLFSRDIEEYFYEYYIILYYLFSIFGSLVFISLYFYSYYSSKSKKIRIFSIIFLLLIEIFVYFFAGVYYLLIFLPNLFVLVLFVKNFDSDLEQYTWINKDKGNEKLIQKSKVSSNFSLFPSSSYKLISITYIIGYISYLILLLFESLFNDLQNLIYESIYTFKTNDYPIYNYYHQPINILLGFFIYSSVWPILVLLRLNELFKVIFYHEISSAFTGPMILFSVCEIGLAIGFPVLYIILYYKKQSAIKQKLNNEKNLAVIFLSFPILVHIIWIIIQVQFGLSNNISSDILKGFIVIQFVRIETILGWNIFLICYVLFIYLLLKNEITKQKINRNLVFFIVIYLGMFLLFVILDCFRFITNSFI